MSTPAGNPPATPRRRYKAPINTPDPNLDRPDNYPNKWTVKLGNQTAKCGICRLSLRGTFWYFSCVNCGKVVCQLCWDGERFKNGEKVFEGPAQNEDGCWCRFGNSLDPKYQPEFDARVKRILNRGRRDVNEIEEGVANPAGCEEESESSVETPPSKRLKMDRSSEEVVEQGGEDEAPHNSDDTGPTEVTGSQDEDDEMEEIGTAAPKLLPILHLQDKTTVIIGAGVVGLSVARALAVDAQISGTRHNIVVVEANKTYASHASGDCAGWITEHGMTTALLPLYELSLEAWKDILSTDGVADRVCHRPNSIVHVNPRGSTHQPKKVPSWYTGVGPDDTFKNQGSESGKVSTAKFCSWLYEECLSLDVVFHFSQRMTDHFRYKKPKDNEIELSSTVSGGESKGLIQCHSLVLAAGPWTAGIFEEYFPWTDLELKNHVDRYDWIRVPKGTFMSGNDLGLRLREGSAGEVIMSAQPDAHSILVAKSTPDNKHAAIYPQQAVDGTKAYNTNFLESLADNRMGSLSSVHSVKGSSYVSTALEGLPHIDKVHPRIIDQRATHTPAFSDLGVYLCYGFGKYGTTLAPGAARALCRLICEEDIGIDLSPFARPYSELARC